MKSFFSKLLPFFFVAMLSFAPLNAQAASYGPTGPRDGMFDCLGNLDWGCRIISFLFESTDNGNDNSVTYYKDGVAQTPEQPTPAIKALHAMMGFFSNVLLIFAAIKLLYELIQMTAESAQTGQVGGKDTNKLWAPIRLVIAIGLLVPLETGGGLNSGQFIVLQIAKWGSGVASQAWKLFTQKLSEGEALSKPAPPRIKDLAYSTAKSYACMGFINYYAAKVGLANDIVDDETSSVDNTTRITFKNKIYSDVCGIIRYRVPLRTYANREEDARLSLQLTQDNQNDYIKASEKIYIEIDNMIQRFLPDGRYMPAPSLENLNKIVNQYQDGVNSRIQGYEAKAKAAMQAITDQIQNAANTQGWTSAGTWFLAITRAQGQIINGAANIPEASGPNLSAFQNYKAAYADYQRFASFLEQGAQPASNSATLNPPNPGAGFSNMTATSEAGSWREFIKSIWNNTTEAPADAIFWFLDRGAAVIGLWDADPKKAFGDLGASTNPFGEIAALGHKKIRLALNFIGYAVVVTGGGALLSMFPVAKVAGAVMSGLAALLMMIATLFLLAGVLLAYIVPLFPFTRFFFSILTWLGSLIEAMVLVPFMALAFLTPKGEGFSGPNTRNAFFLIFQLFLRPILCLFGLMCAMILFYVAAKFLNASFYAATSGIGDYEGSAMRFMQKLVYSVMYVGLIYSAANISFKMIEHLPKHALKWMGGSASEESYDDNNSFMGIATAVGGQQLLSQLQALPSNMISPLTKGLEAHGNNKRTAKDEEEKKENKRAGDKKHAQLLNAIAGGRNNGGPIGDGSPNPRPIGGGGGDRGGGGSEAGAPLPGSAEDDGSQRQLASTQSPLYQAQQEHQRVSQMAEGIQQEIDQQANELAGVDPSSNRSRYEYLTSAIQQNVNRLAGMGIQARTPNIMAVASMVPRPSVAMNPHNRIEQLEDRITQLRTGTTTGSGTTTT